MSSLPISVTTQKLISLIDEHLGELRGKDPKWQILDSPIAGRGIFAASDIATGEIILREGALLTGPTANPSSKLNTCCVCYCRLEGLESEFICKYGCSMPICERCCDSDRHSMECQLLRKWHPKDISKVNRHSLRIISIIKCYGLNEQQRELLYALQANADKFYMQEINKASECFKYFPTDNDILEYFFRTICAFNTNAYEGSSKIDGHEVSIRALFPLAGLLNHQCTPNSNHYFDNAETIVISAARPIAKGEEIVTTYSKLLWSNLARKMFLSLTKHFMCFCQRCLDPTENETYLSALLCREQGCKGIVIPVQTKTMQPDWRCLTCERILPHAKMARYQDFALNTINNRINVSNVSDMINFIDEVCPRFCPPSNYVLVEAKLNVIWRMSKMKADEFTEDELKCRDRYKEEILGLLEKLGAGECTLKKLITEQIQ